MKIHREARTGMRAVLVVATVAVLLAVSTACGTTPVPDDGDGMSPPRPAGPGALPDGPAGRSFAWVARPDGPFDDAQIRELASGYTYVVMDRAHGRADIRTQLDDARRIDRARPATRVLIYVNAAFWYDTNSRPDGWDAGFDPSWSLTDPATGGPLRFSGTAGRELATFVDLGDEAYRAQVTRLIRSWADKAPIDGIAFDSVQPAAADRVVIGHPGTTWADVLPGDRLARYNAGLVALLRETRALLGPGREVLMNGIADTPLAADRNLELAGEVDAVADEQFCLDTAVRYDPATLREDLDLMAELARRGIRVLEKTNTRGAVTGPALARLGRFCTGAFLLGWQPGSTFFKFGPDYSTAELESNPAEVSAPLGRPLGERRENAGMARRDFENGIVLVNLSGRPGVVRPRVSGTLLAGGARTPFGVDDVVTVGPQDAVVVLGRPSR